MNFSDPKTNILQMSLRDGMKVADLGAGSGHYSLAASAYVGLTGKVYAKRILKSDGKLMVIDWAGAYGGMGPAPHHVVTEHKAEEYFIGGGFYKVKDFRAGPHHYGILFTAP